MWVAVKNENSSMLAASVYNAFLLVPLYIGMTYKTDIHVHGPVSKRFYWNIMNYLQPIMCDFSDSLSKINITVDGFKEEDADPQVIGTGISCGVDSLSSIYNRYVLEKDPDFRVNGLCFYSSGVHGKYGSKDAESLFAKRYASVKQAADELSLPLYVIDTNLHSFVLGREWYGSRTIYFAYYSCIIALERGIKKYYVPSEYRYGRMMKYAYNAAKEIDFSEFSGPYSQPLIRTGNLEFIPEGSQFDRSQKTEQIADWKIAREHLEVCNDVESRAKEYDIHKNCSHCEKCRRALYAFDAMGKLSDFAGVFDVELYKKHRLEFLCLFTLNRDLDGFNRDNYDFCKAHGMKLPSVIFSLFYMTFKRPQVVIRWFMQKLLPQETFRRILWRHRYSGDK